MARHRAPAWLVAIAIAGGGCDFRPPPVPVATAAAPPTAGSAVAVGSAAATAPMPADPVTPDCVAVADHLVDLATAAIKSDNERAVQTANHARNVRATAEACTKAAWTPTMLRCLAAASSQAAAGTCMQPPR